MVYPPSLDFMVAFLACLKAGIIAVPVFPPNPLRRDTLNMFASIVATCKATFALTNREYNHIKQMTSIRHKLTQWGSKSKRPVWPDSLQWIVTDTTAAGSKPNRNKSAAPQLTAPKARNQLAFLQFTSGSTSAPKGVMITHGNLAHNLSIITNELQVVENNTVVVSWLPQYHDMGLIGSYLGILYCGGSGYYMSPLHFLQRPMLWIEAMSKYKATHLQAPNFAFTLTARKFTANGNNSSSKLDLSFVRHIINAAEPVDEASIDAFYETFGKFGLKDGVIYPTYGLAEHTVFVCSGGKQRLSVDKKALEVDGRVVVMDGSSCNNNGAEVSRLVGCGYPARQGVDVKIVNKESFEALPEDQVGEIWVNSPSKAAGYYEKPEETKEDFHGQLANAEIEGGYLRTGDLGFFHHNELFICGRLKDLIIVGGRNYYPQDLEATAEGVSDLLRPGCSAAFTIDPTHEGGEEVALVMELRDSSTAQDVCADLANQVRSAINQEHSLSIVETVLLKPRTVPKTSSGKIARAWCRKAYVGGTLQVVYRKAFKTMTSMSLEMESSKHNNASDSAAPRVSAEEAAQFRSLSKKEILSRLVRDVSRVGGIPEESVDTKVALVTMLDSLTITQFKGMLENSYAVKLSDEYLFRESSTLTKLVEVVKLGHAPDDGDGESSSSAPASSSAQAGTAGGLAGALGCPPGVRCIIL